MNFAAQARRVPLATYRWQLRREFPFAAATALVRYAAELGISDYYVSPILLSTPGSAHGYDVNDYRRIDPELGGREELGRLHDALHATGMGLVLDFVPNHMGINGPGLANTWWRDVLENGIHSRYAGFFDIDWSDGAGDGVAQVLVPILDQHYGRVLEEGRLTLVCEEGGLSLAFGELRFPVRPQTYQAVLALLSVPGGTAGEIGELAQAFAALPKAEASEDNAAAARRTQRLVELKRRFAAVLDRRSEVRESFGARLAALNGRPGEPASFDALDRLITQQHYRLAFWKAGVHETNYRRFFAIDSLIGLRVEEPEVFAETHALLGRLLAEGVVTGVRIDHIDGLRQPRQYLERLQQLGSHGNRGVAPPPSRPAATPAEARTGAGESSLYVVVEKILAENEPLAGDWATHGTTGYEFIAQLAGIFVDPDAARRFTATYAEFTGEGADFEAVVCEKKRLILEEMFANAVTRLATQLADAVQIDRRWCDVSRHELTVAVREMMAAHGVYRTYRRGVQPMDERDRRVVEQASAIAVARNPRLDAAPLELVRDALTGAYPGGDTSTPLQRAQAEQLGAWALSFQQYTGAVMAKAVEDTAFYTYSRFIALNEVGGNPGRFGGTVAGFHQANAERARVTPHALLTTSTHDTKLGEDARVRLHALSEIPHEWAEAVAEWRMLNQRHKTTLDGRAAPDANEEYRFYQVLLAAWPADDAAPDDTLRARLREHLRKAVNEAKRNTTWVQPNEHWLEACDKFVDALLSAESGREFLASFRPRARWIAHLGMVNSLAQVALKITSPGVPDFYQGSELWDFSLVDPDNRRPVDFERRTAMARTPLSQLRWPDLLRDWRSGEIKLQLTRALLRFRAEHAELFQRGEYLPLEAGGRFAEHVVAFARRTKAETVVVIVPRLTSRLGCPPLGLVWDDTTVLLPEAGERGWRDVVTGREVPHDRALLLAEAFRELPVVVMVSVK